jgi:hypothetical protein
MVFSYFLVLKHGINAICGQKTFFLVLKHGITVFPGFEAWYYCYLWSENVFPGFEAWYYCYLIPGEHTISGCSRLNAKREACQSIKTMKSIKNDANF